MATDLELWALTLDVERKHGADTPIHIAERIGAAAMAGDQIGVELWTAVAVRYDQLSSRSPGRA